MRFPLADWISSHSDVPHNLGGSSMVGALRTTPRILRHPVDGTADQLSHRIARIYRVPADRVFLTHGATEGNSWVLLYLARRIRTSEGRSARFSSPIPEYPSIPGTARAVGSRIVPLDRPHDVTGLSYPNNPTGRLASPREITDGATSARWTLVDETFREFTRTPSMVRRNDLPGLWVTGTFTKVYGADGIRVGYVIAPTAERDPFATFHGLVGDEIPTASVRSAHALLDHRETVLRESRDIFARNLAYLQNALPSVPALSAPLWFDRVEPGSDGNTLSQRALRAGVLVCPGSYFGEPRGVRVCLTQRGFPRDLDAYLEVRSTYLRTLPRTAKGP
jgi:histidinol-phosphate/aromatic aminotransferase/cobyric acid decarboxylase-like protein